MKKTILLCAACIISMFASAQLLEVVSTRQLPIHSGEELKVAGFSPKCNYLLLTNDVNNGLIRYDLATGATQTISEASGAGWSVKISEDGQCIVYRERYMETDQLMKHNIVKYDMSDQKKAIVAKNQRNMNQLVHANGANSVTINEDLHMMLVHNGKNIVLAPNGTNEAYNWASISPDGQKILYYVSGRGCYTCDLKGGNVQYIADHCRAPQWYDNNTIIGMHDEDDGKYLTASAIVAYNLQGQKQILVNKEMMAIYPYAAEGQIAFSTAGGEIYLMKVK
jgi:Tol biopolymer transport system component